MTMSMMKRTAPLSLLCCGVQNGGGVSGVSRLRAPLQTFSQKREDELDGYTEEADGWTVKTGINGVKLPLKSQLELPDSGCEELVMPELERETRELLRQFYRSHTGLPVKYRRNKPHSALPSLQRVVGKVLYKHRIAYNGEVYCSKMGLK